MNVVLCRERTIADVTDGVKMRASLTTQTGLMSDICKDRGRDQNGAPTSQGMPRDTRSWKTQLRMLPRVFEGVDFEFVSSCYVVGYVSAPVISAYDKPKVQIHDASITSQQLAFVH